jgi:hypothetical protein
MLCPASLTQENTGPVLKAGCDAETPSKRRTKHLPIRLRLDPNTANYVFPQRFCPLVCSGRRKPPQCVL